MQHHLVARDSVAQLLEMFQAALQLDDTHPNVAKDSINCILNWEKHSNANWHLEAQSFVKIPQKSRCCCPSSEQDESRLCINSSSN